VFFINLPVGSLLAAAAPSLVAAVRPAHRARRLDLPGALTGTLATAAIIYGLVSAGSDGWGATTTLFPLAAGLVLAGGFVVVERTVREPLVPLGLLARRPLLAGQLVMLASSGLLLATYFLASLYLQRLLGYSALDAGLVFLPAALATIVGSHLAALAVGHLGPRPVAVVGFTLAAAGTLVLSRLSADASILVDLLPGLLLATAGLGAGFVVATTTAMAHVDRAGRGDLGAAQHRPRARCLPGGGRGLHDRRRQPRQRPPARPASGQGVRPGIPGLRSDRRGGRCGRPVAAAAGPPPRHRPAPLPPLTSDPPCTASKELP
jgi:Na+/melibiose symporter-like transporter